SLTENNGNVDPNKEWRPLKKKKAFIDYQPVIIDTPCPWQPTAMAITAAKQLEQSQWKCQTQAEVKVDCVQAFKGNAAVAIDFQSCTTTKGKVTVNVNIDIKANIDLMS
ncbi:hypothetical protein FRB93_013989, partial [Tulasnella sp. JGI-2019a]